jgi:hypothetical protein
VEKPIQGAIKGGAKGAAIGLGEGVVNVVRVIRPSKCASDSEAQSWLAAPLPFSRYCYTAFVCCTKPSYMCRDGGTPSTNV